MAGKRLANPWEGYTIEPEIYMKLQEDRFLKESALLNAAPNLIKANLKRLIEATQKGPEALRAKLAKIRAEAKNRKAQ